MHRLAVSTVIALAWLTVASSQLPCTSQLRLILPHLFTHCACSFSEWTEWEPIKIELVRVSQCPSGEAITEQRRQRVVSGNCVERREERVVCAPEVVDRLILALGLGSNGQHITPGAPLSDVITAPFRVDNGPVLEVPQNVTLVTVAPPIRGRRSNCDSGNICVDISNTGRRRRSERKRPNKPRRAAPDPDLLKDDPIPFDFLEHGKRYRRQTTDCQPDGTRHILFMLDTSGSIGKTEFDRMTTTLSTLVTLFCSPIKIAVMTFNQEYFVEFCFNCFDNTCIGRQEAGIAMRSIVYRSGATYTAGAAKCACEFFLTGSCGLDLAANCIDVVVITDGRSNDRNRQVCTEVQCLHSRFGVNTYAIGITNNVNQAELDCITNNSLNPGQSHLFSFNSFDEFNQALDDIIVVLSNPVPTPNGDIYTCIDPQPDNGLGTSSCTFK